MPHKLHVLVIGKSAQLGQSLAKIVQNYPQYQLSFVGRDVLDLSSATSIAGYFEGKVFDAMINCAAYTAVDKAESEIELACQLNHWAVAQLAKIALAQDAVFIHISSDYVFDGKNHKPYLEADIAAPQGVYGMSKWQGEQALQAINPKGCIIRTSWVYSEFGHNFVKTMLRLGKERDALNVVFDQVGSPTYAGDLAHAILKLLSVKHLTLETYHYSNEGVCSWYDFAKTIFELSKVACDVKPIETQDYPMPAKRPHYSLMSNAKIKQHFNLIIPYWKDSLKTCLHLLGEEK